MKVVYLLPHASLCGGVKVIAEHVAGLIARGHEAVVWGLTGDFSWFPRHVPHHQFGSTDELGAAMQTLTGAKFVATFWVTASWIPGNLRGQSKGFYLIQDHDELTYGGSTAGTSYRLGLTPITEGAFVTEEIERLYGAKCHNVGIGVDPEVYWPLPFVRERYRVLTPYRPGAGPNDLKGWDAAADALRQLAASCSRVSVVTFGGDGSPRIDWMPHIHLDSPSDGKLRELYSQSGVFLSASRREGFGLPMLEAMACGCPVVCTDSGGNREFCRDGDTALVRDQGDAGGLARAMKTVTDDDRLRNSLAVNGSTAAANYRWPAVLDKLEGVLERSI